MAWSLCRALLLVWATTMAGVVPTVGASSSAQVDPALLEQIRRSNAECFACHTDAGLKHPPHPGLDLAKLQDLLLEPEVFKGSNHGHMECKQCHGQGYSKFPHAPGARDEISPCEECHAVKVMKIEVQFEASVHAKRLADQFTCNTCHDPHVALVAAKLGDPRQIVRQDNQMCLDCHNSDLEFAKLVPDKKRRPDIDRIHEWLPNTRLHWEAVRCVECHTPAAKTLSHEIVDKERAERKCVSCHTADTALATRLYRHLAAEEQKKYGFVNSVILSNSYVVGATRNAVLDALVIALAIATLLAVLVHGAIRVALAIAKRRKTQ
jgi:predicted CXXCH cytochrome family protein